MKAKLRFILPIVLVMGIVWAAKMGAVNIDYRPVENAAIDTLGHSSAYDRMMDVIMHQRCMNCHPSDNTPRQGEDSHPHYFGIERGKAGMGFQATNCNTCHQSKNNGYSGVPGAPHWSLAPSSMGWQGLSREEIAKKILDTKTNGGKDHKELVKHLTEDALVLWAWEPGLNTNGIQRELPPLSEEEFKIAVKKWFNAGAIIPSK